MHYKHLLLPVLACLAISGCAAESKSGDAYRPLADDGAWCWYQDPRAVYVKGEHERLYFGWMTHDG